MLRIIWGRAGAGKTGIVLSELQERSAAGKAGGFLIVPEQYSHEAERELAMRCGDTASLYVEVLSFTRLAHRIAQETGQSARTYLDAGGRLLQLALALEQVWPSLRVYGAARSSPELMGKLLSALSELRFGGADSEALRSASEQTEGSLADKLADLALLREALDAMESVTGADPASRLEILTEQIPRSRMLAGAAVYLDGFTDFTAQERAVIRALWQVCDVTVCLTCDDPADGSEVFSAARRTVGRFRSDAGADGIEVSVVRVPSPEEGGVMDALEAHLFGWTEEVFDPRGAVRLVSAPDIQAECELAAAEALRLAREEGCRWRDIAVAVRGFEDYRSVLAETFRRYGVPLYASARTDIFSRPLPALMGAAFDILSDGWSYESVFTYLKTGLTGLSRPDRDELENYVLTWSIRGTAWTREAPWRQHPEGYNGKPTPESDAVLARLDALRKKVAAPLARFARSGTEAATAAGQCRAVAELWEDISLADNLTERADALRAAGEVQAAAEYAQLWELMVSALEQCAAVLGDMPMDQETFGRLFRKMLSEYDVGTIPVALDQVTAGDFDRMRRRSIRHLLVLGCSDDRLPRIDQGGELLTDQDRAALRGMDIDLPDADDVLDREFNLIYNVLTLPERTLYVSRSRFAPDGSEARPSFVSDRLRRLFGLTEERGDLTAARLSAPGPALELAAAGNADAAAWFASRPEAERLEALRASAQTARGRLSRGAVRRLYGDRLYLTATRIDNFASCRFQYFLRYGLKARPRQQAAFSPPELGTFLHYLLENVARDVTAMGGFAAAEEETVAALSDKYAAEYIRTVLEDFREKSARFVYLFRRTVETARRIVLDTARELARSDFVPLDFELNFSDADNKMPPVTLGTGDAGLVLTGVADRVDGWEKDGKLYLRVVDYKSGKKSFSLTDVWYGMGLQMLLYLFSLEKNGRSRYEKEIVPAGVLYVPARDVLISAKERLTDEEIVKEKARHLRRSGLLLSDGDVLRAMEHGERPEYLPVSVNREGAYTGEALASAEQLGRLSRYVEELLTRMAAELRAGDITADPWYKSDNENTCLYCDYFDACHFDPDSEPCRFRASVKAPEFWARLEREQVPGGEDDASD